MQVESYTDPEPDGAHDSNASALVVDLDGTLIRSDLLIETCFALLKANFFYIFVFPLWLARGKAHLKHEIAERVILDPELLPYQSDFLAYLREEHAKGRRLILATASNEKLAHAVASHLGLFSDVLASDSRHNLSGQRKLERIRRVLGDQGFAYAGNAQIDLLIWEYAEVALVVNAPKGVHRAAMRQGNVDRVFGNSEGGALLHHLRALRVHQWLKNLLVFVPLVMAHELNDVAQIGRAFLAFLAFSLCASSVYLLNDLLDLPDDRKHPTKKSRPLAAGDIPILNGVLLIPVFLASAFLASLALPPTFTAVLGLYYVSTLSYSFRLKRVALLDVITLAGLYTLRIIAGTVAVSTTFSFWLLAFSMFLFFSLALVKRYTELLLAQQDGKVKSSGRGYRTSDLEGLSQFGSASAMMSVMVLALYINSEKVLSLYARPEVIWLLCPLVLYLITRIWFLARRGEVNEDPVLFIIRDRRSQGMALMGALLLWLAI